MMAKTVNEKRLELLQTLLIVGAFVGGFTSNVFASSYGYTVEILQSLIAFILLAVILYTALLSGTTRKGNLYTLEAVAVAITFSFMLSLVDRQIIGSFVQMLLTWLAGTAIITFAFTYDWDRKPIAQDGTTGEATK
jgi:hypothetical protein